jgi:hypothetical protein
MQSVQIQADPEILLSPSHIARILNCHPSAPVRWIQGGSLLSSGVRLKLQAVRTPGGWRVRREWLDQFLAALTADRSRPGKEEGAPKPGPKSERVAQMRAGLAAAGFSS